MANDVVHFEIAGPDVNALKDFYTKVFGWKTEDFGDPPYVIVHKVKGGIGGGIAQLGGAAYATFYVSCDNNIADVLAKAESQGATTMIPVSDVPGGPTIAMDVPGGPTVAQLSDPAGNVIGLGLAGSGPAI